ncbi:MAG: hypothetical protein JOZ73_07545 [Solirubrobacterales bacterium]|nr:hypothetical protein [Solirubrobacterales bacterium]
MWLPALRRPIFLINAESLPASLVIQTSKNALRAEAEIEPAEPDTLPPSAPRLAGLPNSGLMSLW